MLAKTRAMGVTMTSYLAAADCVAVGDGPNDAGMLALAGRSYCMADGMKTAKAAAKALAPARVRLPLRLFGAAAYGDHSGAAGAGV